MYDALEVKDASVEKVMEVVRYEQRTSYEGMLESRLEPTELCRAIKRANGKAASGNDGLGREFCSHIWAIMKDESVSTNCSGQGTHRSSKNEV